MTRPADLLASLMACETCVWDALVAGDAMADAASLSPDFFGVYPDGFAAKADHVGQFGHGPTIKSYATSDAQARPLGADHALVSYRAEFTRSLPDGATVLPEVMYVSSVWQRQGTGWINVFSQDTPAVKSSLIDRLCRVFRDEPLHVASIR